MTGLNSLHRHSVRLILVGEQYSVKKIDLGVDLASHSFQLPEFCWTFFFILSVNSGLLHVKLLLHICVVISGRVMPGGGLGVNMDIRRGSVG